MISKNIKKLSLPCPQGISDTVCKSNVDRGLNDPSIIRNLAHVDVNDKTLDNVRFLKVNNLPAVREHLTSNFYVGEAVSHSVDESSL